MEKDRYKPIQQAWLLSNQHFALGWLGDGREKVRWTFHRVLTFDDFEIAPFTTGLTPIAANGTLDYVVLENSDGKKVFDVTEDFADRIVLHAGIGVRPDIRDFRVFVEYPSGHRLHKVPSYDPVTLTRPDSYVPADLSPYEIPTTAMEFFFPFTVDLALGFMNNDFEEHFPVLNMLARKYLMEVLDPSADAGLVGMLARGQIPCKFATVGRIEAPIEYPASLKKHWAVDPVGLQAAKRLGGGR